MEQIGQTFISSKVYKRKHYRLLQLYRKYLTGVGPSWQQDDGLESFPHHVSNITQKLLKPELCLCVKPEPSAGTFKSVRRKFKNLDVFGRSKIAEEVWIEVHK